jgi:hypothetical protein
MMCLVLVVALVAAGCGGSDPRESSDKDVRRLAADPIFETPPGGRVFFRGSNKRKVLSGPSVAGAWIVGERGPACTEEYWVSTHPRFNLSQQTGEPRIFLTGATRNDKNTGSASVWIGGAEPGGIGAATVVQTLRDQNFRLDDASGEPGGCFVAVQVSD